MDLVVRMDPRHVRDADVVVGFPGPGLVGGIVIEELVETLALDQVGSIGGAVLPPHLVVEDGRPQWPVVCFAAPHILAVKVEVELGDAEAHAFARDLTRYLHDAGARSLTVVEGIAGAPVEVEDLLESGLPPMDTPAPVSGATSDQAMRERMEQAGIEPLDDGVFGGGAAATMLWAETVDLPSAIMGVSARPNLPDVRAAASLVAALARMLGVGVDVAGLRERGEELERAWMRILEDAHAGRKPGDAMFS